jgi:chromate transport protein ChrA
MKRRTGETVTFIGYELGGTRGTLVATIGIFFSPSSLSRSVARWFRALGDHLLPRAFSTVLTLPH